MSQNRLYRSDDQVISGVIGGMAEYFGIDSTILRLVTVFVVVATGIVPGVVTYVVAMFIMPERPRRRQEPGTGAAPGDG